MSTEQDSKKPMWLAIIICGLAAFFYVYDYFVQVAPSVITDQLMQAFSINAEQLGILSSCFFITYTVFQVPAGIFLDRFGARKTLTIAVLVCAVGVILFSGAHRVETAAFARACVGVGTAFAFLGAIFLVSRWFAHRHFALVAGSIQFASALGSIFGQGPLALFVDHYGWREAIFMIGVGSIVLGLLFALILRDSPLPKSTAKKAKKSTAGHPKNSMLYVLKKPQLWCISLCAYIAWVPAAAIGALWGVPYLMKVYNLTNAQAGGLFVVFWLAVGMGGPVIGWFSDKVKRRRLPFLLCFSLGVVTSAALLFAGHYPVWVAAGLLFLLGWAVAVQSLSYGFVKDIVPPVRFASASGLTNMITVLSGATLQPLIGWLLQHNWHGTLNADGVPTYSPHAYKIGLSVIPVIMFIGVLIVLFLIKETYCKRQEV